MSLHSFSQKKSSGIFIPQNGGFIEYTETIENDSFDGIAKHLGSNSDENELYFGDFDDSFDVSRAVIEIFSCKIIFVSTQKTVIKLDKRKVDYFLRDYSFEKEYDSIQTGIILQGFVDNKSFSIAFLSRVLDFKYIQTTGNFYSKLIDMYLTFSDGILFEFSYPVGIDEWSKYEEMVFKLESRNKLPEQHWEAEKKTFEAQNNIEKVENILLFERSCEDFFKLYDFSEIEVEKLKSAYLKSEKSAILQYCNLVLSHSEYPKHFSKSFAIDYNPENKILIIEYSLPTIDQIPRLNEVKWVKSEFREYYLSDSQIQNLFDATMYRITLRTIYELFEADAINTIEAISFNGWINVINMATGKHENNCILSIQVKKDKFMEIDLSQVDPKTCFKHFKGVSSSKLYGITAIQPILQIQKNDKRFVNSHSVEFDDLTNLATMAWEDFEHLIRELFEKEFSSNGGEVKVTQASRDGGVDAIAFDPDPIRGGKIVIQAKRYTNTVGVSAVRDLFGTVMNEGANKGILVTTSDYGSDSYEFAKGKPLTLLNGANLLYLLEKHGTRAKIDIKEARRLMNEDGR